MIYKKKKTLDNWHHQNRYKEYVSSSLCFSQFDSFIEVKSRITWTYGTAAGGKVYKAETYFKKMTD